MFGLDRSGSFWPTIDSPAKAVDVMHFGACMAGLGAWVTAAIGAAAIYLGHRVLGMSGWVLVDAALFAIIAWRVYRLSLPWSIAGLILFTLEKLLGFARHPNPGYIYFSLLIFPYYVNAVRGALYLQVTRVPAVEPAAPLAVGEATIEEHEAFRHYLAQQYRAFQKPHITLDGEFRLWLADRRSKAQAQQAG